MAHFIDEHKKVELLFSAEDLKSVLSYGVWLIFSQPWFSLLFLRFYVG